MLLERALPYRAVVRTDRQLADPPDPMTDQAKEPVRVFLDDEREPPAGWVLVGWPDETIALLAEGKVAEISLDHDLGDDERGTGSSAEALARLRTDLRGHPLYGLVTSPAALRSFTEHHVICVLDFMSLLKSLQRDLTGPTVPWTPAPDPDATRLIQSIVLDEECDVRADGRVQSHFAWYVEAMEELGADTAPIRELAAELEAGRPFDRAVRDSRLPAASRAFGLATARFLERPIHVRAAVFFHGREEIIPEMFLPIVDELATQGLACETLRAYLERHIEVDGGDHGPRAERMLERLYANDAHRRQEAERIAVESLEARKLLWDAVAAKCDSTPSEVS